MPFIFFVYFIVGSQDYIDYHELWQSLLIVVFGGVDDCKDLLYVTRLNVSYGQFDVKKTSEALIVVSRACQDLSSFA